MDNLRPFVAGQQENVQTTRKRSQFSELTVKRERKNTKTEESRADSAYEQARRTEELRRNTRSPDVARDFTNQIIREIEEKGIHCDWKDWKEVEEVRSEGTLDEEDWSTSSLWSDQPAAKNWSNASTNDRFSTYYNQCYPMDYYTERSRYYDHSYFQITPESIGTDQRTTLMIKNIPNKYTVQLLAEEIDSEMANSYDFLYLPCDIKVPLWSHRTTATWGTGLSTCSTAKHSRPSTANSTGGDGPSSRAKR